MSLHRAQLHGVLGHINALFFTSFKPKQPGEPQACSQQAGMYISRLFSMEAVKLSSCQRKGEVDSSGQVNSFSQTAVLAFP